MPIDPRIPLAGRPVDFGKTVIDARRLKELQNRQNTLLDIAESSEARNQKAFETNQELRREQILGERDRRRLTSIVRGAVELQPLLERGDPREITNFLERRRQALAAAQQQGVDVDTTETSEALDALNTGGVDALRRMVNDTLSVGQRLGVLNSTRADSGFTLSPGQSRFDAAGNEIASLASQPDNKDRLAARKDVRAVARNLRRDLGIDDIVPNFKTFGQAISRGTGTGDTVAIVTAAKILDPGSVVREGEVEVIRRSDGIFGELQTLLGQVQEGGRKLSDTSRRELEAIITQRVRSSRDEFTRRAQSELAGFNGLVDNEFLAQQFADPFGEISDDAGPAAEQPAATEGQRYRNPQTGQEIILRNGQWVDAQTGEPFRG